MRPLPRTVDPLRASLVGKFLDCDAEEHDGVGGALLAAWTPLLDAERDLAFLLGLHARGLARSTARQPAEDGAQAWLSASFLRGGLQGLQPPNPFEEEKTEARSGCSGSGNSNAATPGTTPTEAKTPQLTTTDRASAFLQSLAESRIMVSEWIGVEPGEETKRQEPSSHTIERASRLVAGPANRGAAVARREVLPPARPCDARRVPARPPRRGSGPTAAVRAHQASGTCLARAQSHRPRYRHFTRFDYSYATPAAIALRFLLVAELEEGLSSSVGSDSASMTAVAVTVPRFLGELIRVVHQTKWRLIKARQEQSRSYKEVCARVQERCRFLLFEVRAATSAELRALDRLPLLHVQPRWPRVVRRLIAELRAKKQQPPAKPEDIVNASIQVNETILCNLGSSHFPCLLTRRVGVAEPGRRAEKRGEA